MGLEKGSMQVQCAANENLNRKNPEIEEGGRHEYV